MMYYDLDGNAIRRDEWAAKFTPAHRVVRQTTLKNGKWVSTVWLGLDHGYGNGPPLIFESMVFGPKSEELETRRYATMLQACAGHEALCEKWTKARAARRRMVREEQA